MSILFLRVAASNSTNAANFSSARTTKRFPSPRCASAIQIVVPRRCFRYSRGTFDHGWPCLLAMAFKFSAYVLLVRFPRVAFFDQRRPHRVCANSRLHANLDTLLVTRCSVGILRDFSIRGNLVWFVSSFPGDEKPPWQTRKRASQMSNVSHSGYPNLLDSIAECWNIWICSSSR